MNSATGNRILIIEDEHDVLDMLKTNLQKADGFAMLTATDAAQGLRKAREERPSLIVIDLMLPKMAGLELCKVLKSDGATKHIPIIMLTTKASEIDRIVGLEFGADDYVTKPFSPREIALRVKAILRRGKGDVVEEQLSVGDITVDPTRHQVTANGKPVRLTSVEFKLLSMLMLRRGRVQARDRLLNEVWGYESMIDTRTVDTHVRRLRKKLGKAADAIETVRGFGYRLKEG